MSYSKIWLHFVWSTKNRKPFLTKEIRGMVFEHIRINALSKGILLRIVNGYLDHVHVLIRLKLDQNPAEIARLLKGESSWWINKNRLTEERFEWQHEYYAASVEESGVNRVVRYIENQERHHQRKSFDDEHREFEEKYRFEL
jgi:putative transposase